MGGEEAGGAALAFIIDSGTAIAPGIMGEPQQPGKLFLDAAVPGLARWRALGGSVLLRYCSGDVP